MAPFAITLTLLLLVLALGFAAQVGTLVAQQRTQSLADSAAHSSAGLLAGDERRQALSRELQMGFRCLYDRAKNLTSLDDDSGDGDAADAGALCHDAFNNAKYVLWRNDPRAQIGFFSVDADSRDYTDAGGATRLWAWATVRADGPLAHFPSLCTKYRIDGNDICRVTAQSAAREWG